VHDDAGEELQDGGAAPAPESLTAVSGNDGPEALDAGAAPAPGASAPAALEIEAEDAGGAPSGPG
jgi:hypothetical protein